MTRSLHIIDSLALGGAERMLVEIANATADSGEQMSKLWGWRFVDRTLMLTRAERRANGERLYPFAAEHLDLSQVIRQWQTVYDGLLASPTTRTRQV